MTDSISRVLNIKKEELPLVILSAGFFFCVLCGYYFLRPVRDAMGVSRGMGELRLLFVATSLTSLVLVLVFGGIVARLNRRQFIPIAYIFVILCLCVFAGLLITDATSGGGLIGTDIETPMARIVGYTFFVWLSTINLFVNSIFWAFMVDIFSVDQGKRVFAFIGVGGTTGALCGSWATETISQLTDSAYLPAGLMLIGAVFFGAALIIMMILDKFILVSERPTLTIKNMGSPIAVDNHTEHREKIGGSFWEGLKSVITSPYLLGVGAYIMLMAISNTMIYFTQANIILENTDTFSQRVSSFAQFDMVAQIATLITQIFITTRVIKRIGVAWTLAILPLVTMAGFAALSIWTLYGVMAIFQAVHRATRYAISRPARETLFSVVSRSEKYKAKPVLDVFLYRGGDVVGTGIDGLFAAMGATLATVAAATVPIAGIWTVLCVGLGVGQRRKIEGSEA